MENNSTIKYIVYCTMNIENKKIYVGKHETTTPDKFDGYLGNGCWNNKPSTYENPKYPFQYAVKKYGPSKFIRKTLKVFDTEEDALFFEAEIVNEEFLKRPDVYNIALGGTAGGFYTQQISVYQYTETGEFVAEYKSMSYAAKQVNRSFRSIWGAINDKCKCANYFWTKVKYDKLDLTKMRYYEGINTIPVFQYSKTGEYECCYDSIKEASKILNINDASISRAIKLGSICHNKYFLSNYSPNFSIAKSEKINSQKVYQYDLDGNFIAEYNNMNQAKKALGIKGNIYQAIKLNNLCGGFQWKFEKFDNIGKVQPKSGRIRKVGKYTKDWELVEIYPSLAECKRQNGAACQCVLQGRNEFSKGFRYKYED